MSILWLLLEIHNFAKKQNMKRLFISCALALFMLAGHNVFAKVPVYIMAGQSNADGRALVSEMPEYIREYVSDGGSDLIMMSYCNGITRNELGAFKKYVPMYEGNTSEMCGFDAIVYNHIADKTGNSFYVIKESKGGTAIDTLCSSSASLYWNATPEWLEKAGIANHNKETKESIGKSLLLQLEANIDACIDNVLSKIDEGYEIKCVMWHQGESDRKQGENYYGNLRRLVEHLRSHIVEKTGNISYSKLPFIAGSVNKASRQYNRNVEAAKVRLAGEDPDFHVVNLDGCELRDDDKLHFNAKGCVEAGKRMFDKLTGLGLISTK